MADVAHLNDIANLNTGAAASDKAADPCQPLHNAGRFTFFGIVIAWQLGLTIALLAESTRLKQRFLHQGSPGNWSDAPAWDGSWFVPLLLLAPFCWGAPIFNSKLSQFTQLWTILNERRVHSQRERVAGATTLFLLSLLTSWNAAQFAIPHELPPRTVADALPLVQDEFSYQLQAEGILQGRWSWPGPETAPELFHQMHVLNEGQFASRYFPGTGLWLAPWEAFDLATWGARVAGALAAAGFFLVGSLLGGRFVGAVAGVLIALSPGWGIFNNLLLAHAPTLSGLAIFLLGMVQLVATGAPRNALLAGMGLAFAMLCRPLTAAAIGLPWGLWFFWQWGNALLHSHSSGTGERRKWTLSALGLGIPLLLGFLLMGAQNSSVTGDAFLSGYQQYTQIYTPRHSFGFHQSENENRPSDHQQKVLTTYNEWAVELDTTLAISNAVQRLKGSLEWSLGLIPLAMTGVIWLFTFPWQSRTVQLIGASIVSLNLAHIPYWLDGMLGHHYVLESGPLWILLFAVISQQVLAFSIQQRRFLPAIWWGGLVGVSLVMNLCPVGPNGQSRLAAGWEPFVRSTAGYRAFESTLSEAAIKSPALIFVRPTEADLHALFVRNKPPFDADILIGMESPQRYSLEEIAILFPERSLYLYDSATRSLQLIQSATRSAGGGHE